MNKEILKIYVNKVEKIRNSFSNEGVERTLVVKTSFSKYPLEIRLTDETMKEDSFFVAKVENAMGNLFARFLDENNYKIKNPVGSFHVLYYFNREYSASGNSVYTYQSLVNKDYLTITTSLDLSLPLSEREILLFSRGAQKYFSR